LQASSGGLQVSSENSCSLVEQEGIHLLVHLTVMVAKLLKTRSRSIPPHQFERWT